MKLHSPNTFINMELIIEVQRKDISTAFTSALNDSYL